VAQIVPKAQARQRASSRFVPCGLPAAATFASERHLSADTVAAMWKPAKFAGVGQEPLNQLSTTGENWISAAVDTSSDRRLFQTRDGSS
jgi:hypothetical protein